jgi:Sugar kinases, ribokinase family
MYKKKVVGIGEILWDVLPSGKEVGGAPANFAYHVQELGVDSVIVSSVGKDELGQEIVSIIEKRDMSSDFINYVDNGQTGNGFCEN